MATGAAAHADTTMITSDNVGILNGTQVYAPIQAPVNLCGVAAAVGGGAVAGCEGGSAASLKEVYDVKMISTDNVGVLNGTQVFLPVQLPVNACGVAVAVLGAAGAHCVGGASATIDNDWKRKTHKESGGRTESTGDDAEEGKPCHGCPPANQPPAQQPPPANQPPAQQPPAQQPPACVCPPHKHKHHYHHDEDVTMISKGNVGILNGTQVYAPIQAPINVSSVSAGILGHAWSWSHGGSSARM